MHRLSFTHRFVQIIHYLGGRHHIRYAHTFALLFQGRLCTHPDNMVNRQFISKNNLLVLVNVDNRRQAGKGQTEIIQKCRILPVTESVIFIMQPLLVIT